jgi:glycosyltransferase involved in cell wall biosynthesis
MKKILFVITSSEIGGAQRFVQEQIYILYDSNYECYLSTNSKGWLTQQVEKKLSNAFYSPLINKFSIKFIFDLCLFIYTNKIDLIVCNSANGGFYGRISAFFMNVKCIYVSHGWSSIYNGGMFSTFYNKIEYFLSLITTNILCISKNDYLNAEKVIGVNQNKLTLIPNSIFPLKHNVDIFKNNNKLKVLTVCRLKHPKRVDLLISAFSKFNNFDLTIIGDGPDKDLLVSQTKALGLSNVLFLGELNGFSNFHSYDIFVLISDSEGLPISVLEAMSSGLGLVISNIGGCPELINDNGVLVTNCIEDIENGLNFCINNIEKFKLNSLSFFNSNYNLDNNRKRYLDYYNSFLDIDV